MPYPPFSPLKLPSTPSFTFSIAHQEREKKATKIIL